MTQCHRTTLGPHTGRDHGKTTCPPTHGLLGQRGRQNLMSGRPVDSKVDRRPLYPCWPTPRRSLVTARSMLRERHIFRPTLWSHPSARTVLPCSTRRNAPMCRHMHPGICSRLPSVNADTVRARPAEAVGHRSECPSGNARRPRATGRRWPTPRSQRSIPIGSRTSNIAGGKRGEGTRSRALPSFMRRGRERSHLGKCRRTCVGGQGTSPVPETVLGPPRNSPAKRACPQREFEDRPTELAP